MKEITRRDFLKWTGAAGAAASAVAVFGGTGMVEAAAAAESKMVDNMNIGVMGAYNSLVPVRNGGYQWQIFVRYLYERVIYRTASGTYIPQAAKAWSVGEDGLTWTVELYDNITDAAGNHITAEDVVWMIMSNKEQGLKTCFRKVEECRILNDYTFEVVMNSDIADTFEIAMASTYIVSKAAFEASADGFANNCVSTSPYKVTEYISGNSMTLELREDYWQDPELIPDVLACHVKKMTLPTITEVSQQQIAMESGTCDAFMAMNSTIVHSFENNSEYEVIKGMSATGVQMYYSGVDNRQVANDENLRWAINTCIDINGIIKTCADGRAEPMHDFVPKTSVGYEAAWDEEEYYPYDDKKAREYLKASSYNGEKLVLSCQTGNSKLAQMIQAYCGAIGINLELSIEDAALFNTHQYDGSSWDMTLTSNGNGLVNVWSIRFDGEGYNKGTTDAAGRYDAELTEMIHHTWQNANFTYENKTKVHKYIYDKAYAYGLYLSQCANVVDARMAPAEPMMAPSGECDFAASIYA